MRSGGDTLVGRSVRAFWLFGLALVALYGLIVATVGAKLEDRLFERRLSLEVDHFVESLDGPPGPDTALPTARFMQGYLGIEQLPPDIRADVEGHPDGILELGWMWDPQGPEYHVAIRTLGEDGPRLYLVYDVSSLEVDQGWLSPLFLALAIGLLTILPLGLWWGRRLASRAVSPIIDLAASVERSSPSELARLPDPTSSPREVATLTHALRESMRRVEAFVERERRFTGNASHELRTPVAVIRGAVELLEPHLPAGDERAQSQLRRIARSVESMEEIIEAFLWLAREGEADGAPHQCRLERVVPEVLEQYRHLLRDKQVDVEVDLDGGLTVNAPEPVVSIAVGNLLSNAFYNTQEGSVRITLDGDRLSIRDTGGGIPSERLHSITSPFVSGRSEAGHGLGLAIVDEICHRFGWRLEFSSRPGRGTETVLHLAR